MYAIPAAPSRPATIVRTSSSSVTAGPQPPCDLWQGRSRLAPSSAGPLKPQLAPHPSEVVGWPALQALARREILHVFEERDDPGARGFEASGLARRATVEGGQRLIEPAPVVALVEGLYDLGGGFWRHLVLGPRPSRGTAFERPLNAL